MSAQRLLDHYARIAEAPDAIPRLRRFILDLAVRGKLMPQDPKDEPASELLRRIAAAKARGKKREQAEMETIEKWRDLPSNWSLVPLIALGSWAIGAGFPKQEQGLAEGPHFFLKVSDMNLPGNEKYITISNNCIDDAAAMRIRAKIHPPGTIIFPKIGGAIATNKRRILTRGSAIDNNCLGITFSKEIDIEWAYLVMTTLDFTRYQVGTAVPALQQGVLELIPVDLPPLDEQRRIVAKVDELMALCDRLEATRAEREATRDRLTAASLARLNAPDPDTFHDDARFALAALSALTTRPDQIKQLRQTILNLAVRGKLVQQNPAEGTGQDLLRELVKVRAQAQHNGRVRRTTVEKQVSENEKYKEVPSSWAWMRLLEVGMTQTGTSPSSANPDLFGDHIPFVKPADLDGGAIKYDGPGLSKQGMEHSRVAPAKTVLMVCIGATLGKVNVSDRTICFNQQINSVTPYIEGIHRFVALALKASGFQELAWSKAGTGTLPIISKGKWEVLPIPLPPPAEQHRIVAKVDELMALCDRLEATLSIGEDTRRRLLDALLAEALENRIVAPAIEAA